jgi:hypothetical protein
MVKPDMMKCELIQNRDTGSVLAATFTYEDGKVTAVAEPGHENAVRDWQNDPVVVPPGRKIMYKDDPKGWFMGLPFQYHGTYLYARMVPDAQKKKTAIEKAACREFGKE